MSVDEIKKHRLTTVTNFETVTKNVLETIGVELPHITKLPESVFVSHFLEFFRSGMTNDPSGLLRLKWIELAKTPYYPVNIIDPKGNIIFKVPPLLMRTSLDSDICKYNFDKLGQDYKLMVNVHSGRAENMVNNELRGKAEGLKTTATEDYGVLWTAIFNRYKPKVLTPNTNISNPVPDGANVNSIVNYD